MAPAISLGLEPVEEINQNAPPNNRNEMNGAHQNRNRGLDVPGGRLDPSSVQEVQNVFHNHEEEEDPGEVAIDSEAEIEF